MGKTRREFTPEYKDEAVKLAINTGDVTPVAFELQYSSETAGVQLAAYPVSTNRGQGQYARFTEKQKSPADEVSALLADADANDDAEDARFEPTSPG